MYFTLRFPALVLVVFEFCCVKKISPKTFHENLVLLTAADAIVHSDVPDKEEAEAVDEKIEEGKINFG